MLLQLNFEYDRETTVICYFDHVTNKLQVLGLTTDRFNRQNGGMVRAFYENANAEVLENASELADFCVQLRLACRQVVHGGSIPTWVSAWTQGINVHIEDLSTSDAKLRTGMAVRFYREDGPQGTWIWKDTIRSIFVLLKPAPVRVEL